MQSGTVKINHGQGFQTVTGEVRVSPGDLVMVEPSSMVTLVYDSNPCAIPLAAQQVTVVGPEAKCVAEAPAPDTPPPTEGGTTALSSTQMAIGIGALAGVAAIGIAASSSSKKSASP